MERGKKKRLEKKGWRIASAAEFLDLTPEENRYIELKLALGEHLKRRRRSRRMSQEMLAKLVSSSQSRVAKMEAADPSVSLDLLVRSLLALGSVGFRMARAGGTTRTPWSASMRRLRTPISPEAAIFPRHGGVNDSEPDLGSHGVRPVSRAAHSPFLRLVTR